MHITHILLMYQSVALADSHAALVYIKSRVFCIAICMVPAGVHLEKLSRGVKLTVKKFGARDRGR